MDRGDGGLERERAGGPAASACSTRVVPRATRSRSHRERSCSASGTRSPRSSVRAGARAWVSSIRASRLAVSVSSGSERCSRSVTRIASMARSVSMRFAPRDVAYPSLKVRYRTCRTACSRPGRSAAVGASKRAPAPRRVAFARLIRCAMVASGTRNPAAICAVVSPATARRVRATCELSLSAGWAQSSSICTVSSSCGSASAAGSRPAGSGAYAAASSSRRVRAVWLRWWSMSLRDATRMSHPRGLSGRPSAGHWTEAAISASWTASSHDSKSPLRRRRAARTCGASRRHTSSPASRVTGRCHPTTSPAAARSSRRGRRRPPRSPRRARAWRRRS